MEVNRLLANEFQSTHPARGATPGDILEYVSTNISIHAPREGCDLKCYMRVLFGRIFQSTHPARGATMP